MRIDDAYECRTFLLKLRRLTEQVVVLRNKDAAEPGRAQLEQAILELA